MDISINSMESEEDVQRRKECKLLNFCGKRGALAMELVGVVLGYFYCLIFVAVLMTSLWAIKPITNQDNIGYIYAVAFIFLGKALFANMLCFDSDYSVPKACKQKYPTKTLLRVAIAWIPINLALHVAQVVLACIWASLELNGPGNEGYLALIAILEVSLTGVVVYSTAVVINHYLTTRKVQVSEEADMPAEPMLIV